MSHGALRTLGETQDSLEPQRASSAESSHFSDVAESDRPNSSDDGRDDGQDFASRISLQEQIGGSDLSVQPDLETFGFFTHLDKGAHRICLHVGDCEDANARTQRAVYVFLERTHKTKSAPPISFLKSQAVSEINSSRLDCGPENYSDNAVPDTWSAFANDKSVDLIRPFQALRYISEEFKAVAKFYFVLASSEHPHGYKEHGISKNQSFDLP